MCFDVVLCVGKGNVMVSVSIETFNTNLSRTGHIGADVLPNVANKRTYLFAVRVAHLRKNVRFNGTLIRTHFKHLHLYAHLLQKVGEEDRLRSQTMPINNAAWVD